MNVKVLTETESRLTLMVNKAVDLMTPHPVTIAEEATVREAITLLTENGFSAVPVVDRDGRPVGVLSRSDIVLHDREEIEHVPDVPEFYCRTDLATSAGEHLGRGFQVEKVDRTRVHDIMTPVVFSVPPTATATRVVEDMLALKVHRLFVVDRKGQLMGVISAFDVLRHLE